MAIPKGREIEQMLEGMTPAGAFIFGETLTHLYLVARGVRKAALLDFDCDDKAFWLLVEEARESFPGLYGGAVVRTIEHGEGNWPVTSHAVVKAGAEWIVDVLQRLWQRHPGDLSADDLEQHQVVLGVLLGYDTDAIGSFLGK